MEFTLRQARSLESRLRSLTIEDQIVSIRAYDGDVARTDMSKGIDSLNEEIDNKISLNYIRHLIKYLINVKNMECGVSALLNSRDELHSRRDLLNTLKDPDEVDRQIEYVISNPSDSRMVCLVTRDISDSINMDLAGIEHELNEISRELNELNNNITISLEEDDTEFLKEINLV